MIPLPDIFSAGTAAITTQSFSISVQSSCITSLQVLSLEPLFFQAYFTAATKSVQGKAV